MKTVQTFIVGRGMAGQAMANSVVFLKQKYPELGLLAPQFVNRGERPRPLEDASIKSILLIANPHGLHTSTLMDAVDAGFETILVDKPACVSLDQVVQLRKVPPIVKVHVCHGYRQAWAIQTLKRLIDRGELGELVTLQLRYWQSSVAAQGVSGQPAPKSAWKNDPGLSGKFDVLIDLGSHAVDLITYLVGARPRNARSYLNYSHAQAPHRDSHVEMCLEFDKNIVAMASVSKLFHGSTNDLSLSILGSQKSATWKFLNPDEIEMGRGAEKFYVRRTDGEFGSGMPGFHALGWLEGYLDIIHQTVLTARNEEARPVPTLQEHVNVMETLFKSLPNS